MKRFYGILMSALVAFTFAISAPPASAQFVNTASGSSGVTAPVACDKSVVVNATATSQLVAAVANTSVYVCGFFGTIAGTTPTLAFEYGTGTTCGTGTTLLTGTMAPASGTLFPYPGGLGTLLRTPASQALCVVLGGTSPSMQGVLSYAQF